MIYIKSENTYYALSTDIVNNKLPNAGILGAKIFLTDLGLWKIIKEDLNLANYEQPVTLVGDITIGEVEGTGTAGVPAGGILTVQGDPTNIPIPISGSVYLGDGSNFDAFSRFRVSNPKTIFNSSFRYDLQPVIYESIIVTGGSIASVTSLAAASLTVNTTNGASAALQSKQYHRYIPGKSQLIVMTQVFGSGVASVVKRVGYFDTDNGIFLEQNGVIDVAIVRRTKVSGSVVDNRVVQSNWNLDKLDGTGTSGIILDLSKAQILVIDLQWLGVGRVRIGFDINGRIIYCHEFLNANNLSTVYMQTGNLPIRWIITNSNTSAGTTMYVMCASVLSEGGDEQADGYLFSIASSADVSATGSRTPLLAIRPKATFNSIVNRIEIEPQDFSVMPGNNPVLVELIYNPASLGVTGAWTSADTNSAVEYHNTITSISGGSVIESFFVPSVSNGNRGILNQSVISRLPIVLDSTGANPIPIVICATSITSTSNCRATINWLELR